jgi:hypothetical protein
LAWVGGLIEFTTSAEKKATFLASFADLLWRMEQPEQARTRYGVARTIALKMVDPARRKPVLAMINQGLQFVSDPPPDLISATPHPRPRPNVQNSPIPPFPIRPDRFQDASPQETTSRSGLNGFGKILRTAIHAQDVQMANDAAEIWSKTGDNVGSGVVDAWRVEGRTKEAIHAARRIEDPDLRIGELLGIAGDLLNEAGAPIF